ncbi:MAG: phosphomannomutase/phosphoglucomutase, partial [Gammaproteobacteria bacterium]
MASDPALQSLLESGDRAALEARASILAGRLPGALRLRILPADVSEPRLDENPPLTFASLDLIRRARKSSGPLPAEVHLFGRPDAHLILLERVTDGQGRVIGFLHLSLSTDLLAQALTKVETPGYVELHQPVPKSRPLVLARRGNPALRERGRQQSAHVPGSSWRLLLWLTPAALEGLPVETGSESRLPLLPGSLLAPVLLGGGAGLWWSRRQPRVRVHPGTSYEGAVRAIMEGQYPGMEHLIPGLKRVSGEAPLGKGLEGEDITRITMPGSGDESAELEAVAAKAREAAARDEGEVLDLSGGMEVEELEEGLPEGALEQPDLVLDGEPSAPAPEAAPAAEAAEGDPPASIFRAYDIRGVVGRTLTEEGVYRIGLAIGSEAAQRGQQVIVVARDGRLSGPELSAALIRGLRDSGRDVIDIGMVPTPVLYFATFFLETGSGVMLTGSHNPPDYNGLKIVLGGDTLSGAAITALHERILRNDFTSGEGALQHADIGADYIRRISEDIPVALGRGLKVAVDCGNGVAGALAPSLIRALGHEVIELYCEVDGTFPNHHPDPSQPENLSDLIEAVTGQGADLGLAFDGDGDRLGVVDGEGNIIWPDRQLMLFAIDVLSRNPGADIIFDVKCSGHLKRVIEEHSGRPVMWKTGHSLIKARMK